MFHLPQSCSTLGTLSWTNSRELVLLKRNESTSSSVCSMVVVIFIIHTRTLACTHAHVHAKGKKLYFDFVDMEKAFDRILTEVI